MLEREQLVTEYLSAEELEELFDLNHHLSHAQQIIGRALSEAGSENGWDQ